MKIDRSNYEIWLIDWLDGNLSELQAEQLNLFLNENPDIKEEFGEMGSFSLKPTEKSFKYKEQLKKSTADLSDLQFEYLCVAYLENDLSSLQKTELMESIERYPERKKSFELMQKMRLAPGEITFKHKKNLLKKTPVQKVIRMSVIGLSAAATIAILTTVYLLTPKNLTDGHNDRLLTDIVPKTVTETALQNQSVPAIADKTLTENKQASARQKRENLTGVVPNSNLEIKQSVFESQLVSDSSDNNIVIRELQPDKVKIYAQVALKGTSVSNTLIASTSGFTAPIYDDERSNVGRFIAKTFREKILKEPVSKDTPLQAYEIAEAGVTGLNKLLGWEMALDEKNDENGELRSVYFSSKILKFNAPVKKTQPLP
jgi:hypothetical protein